MVPERGVGDSPCRVPVLHPGDKVGVCLNGDGSGMEHVPSSPCISHRPALVRARSHPKLGCSKVLIGPSCPGYLAILCTQWEKASITGLVLVGILV